MKILIINGPNLNLLGTREPGIYGSQSFLEYFEELKKSFKEHTLEYFQSNVEGEIINTLHSADGEFDAVILNAGGYTHTSVAIADAIGAIKVGVVEVHISCILAREEFRHVSLIAKNCTGSIMGFGLDGYRLAVHSIIK
ncbi:MAG: type II 3-dehydroquinate dehydratase [Rikenellaceae bacterium]